jgi:hypothetical protein
MKRIALTGLMLGLVAAPAAAGGLNFNWNTSQQCPAVATPNWDFACDRNDAVMYMVASFQPDVALAGFNSLDARINALGAGGCPAWWQTFDPGTCRQNAFTPGIVVGNPAAPCAGTSTTRLWTGSTCLGGIGAWDYSRCSAGRFHFVLGYGMVPDRAGPLNINTQYNAFNVAVATTNTVHVDADPDNGVAEVVACSGCETGVTLALEYVGIYGATTSYRMTAPMTSGPNANGLCIFYHGGSGPGSCAAVPARNTTWGQLKGLYR